MISFKEYCLTESFADRVFYHGTNKEFSEFNGPAHFTPSRELASDHADWRVGQDGGKPVVMAVRLNIKNPKVMDDISSIAYAHGEIEELKHQGHDGAVSSDGLEVVAFHPHQVTKHLTESQLELFKPTQADAKKANFKNWFSGSKAVKGNGQPVTMYHTTRNDFHSFEVGRTTKNSGTFGSWETQRHAIFVTPDREASQGYASMWAGTHRSFRDGANVMPVHVAVKNPLDLRDGAHHTFELQDKFKEHGINPNWLNNFHWGHFDGEEGKHFVEAAKKMGHDGVIFHETDPDTEKNFESWAIFHPHQIKSVFNRGTYNPDTPHISEASEPMTRKLTLSVVEIEKKAAQLAEETKDLPMFDAAAKFAEAGIELSESMFDDRVNSKVAMDRFYIATHGEDSHRDQLVKDEDAMVRFGVAKTGHLQHLAQLASDPSPMVRDQVARRGDEELATKLQADPHPMVRSSAFNRLSELKTSAPVNESVEEAKHFEADETIQVAKDGRFAKVKTFFEAKEGGFWYVVDVPAGGSEVLHESEVRSLEESFKVTHYHATVYHGSTGSSHSKDYPFLPEHGADETGLDIDKAKEVLAGLNAKGDKGDIRYSYSLRTEDALKHIDSKRKLQERHGDTDFAAHRELSGEADSRPDMNKPIKLKKADGTIHSTHDNEKDAMHAYNNEPNNKGMKIVREDRENEFSANLSLSGDHSGSKPNKPVKLKRADGSVHSEHDTESSAMQAYKDEKNNKGMKIVRESVEVIDPAELVMEALDGDVFFHVNDVKGVRHTRSAKVRRMSTEEVAQHFGKHLAKEGKGSMKYMTSGENQPEQMHGHEVIIDGKEKYYHMNSINGGPHMFSVVTNAKGKEYDSKWDWQHLHAMKAVQSAHRNAGLHGVDIPLEKYWNSMNEGAKHLDKNGVPYMYEARSLTANDPLPDSDHEYMVVNKNDGKAIFSGCHGDCTEHIAHPVNKDIFHRLEVVPNPRFIEEGFKNECPFCNPVLMESADQQILTEEHEAAVQYHTERAKDQTLSLEERHFHSRCFMKHQREI